MRYWPLLNVMRRRTYRLIGNNAGFFPVDREHLTQFYNLYRQDTKEIDVLVSWRVEEVLVRDWMQGKQQIQKQTLDCFYKQEEPWTKVLEGKRILVVHPFAETITNQYKKRALLFRNPWVLPDFASLSVVKAVQSIAGNPVEFKTWFEALDEMKRRIDMQTYDIALIGCGAYGLPLAAHVKRMGRKAVHMGGILQFLFGIKGKRYIDNSDTARFINEHFVFPIETERPLRATEVEGGCYW